MSVASVRGRWARRHRRAAGGPPSKSGATDALGEARRPPRATPDSFTGPAYLGRTAALATKHGKERILAPALAPIGLEVAVAEVDTDRFGTFTGEIARSGSALEVAVRKARAGMAALRTDAGLASEGSFGPLPETPFLTADVEIVLLVDDRLDLVVCERAVSFETAAAMIAVRPGDDFGRFCADVGFPEQALICRPSDGSRRNICKAITDVELLERAVATAARASEDGRAIIETDLRAHLCPSRRKVIAEAARRLADRLAMACPQCRAPGFGVVHDEPGRPCAECGLPTSASLATVTTCARCGHARRETHRGEADPSGCSWCNP